MADYNIKLNIYDVDNERIVKKAKDTTKFDNIENRQLYILYNLSNISSIILFFSRIIIDSSAISILLPIFNK